MNSVARGVTLLVAALAALTAVAVAVVTAGRATPAASRSTPTAHAIPAAAAPSSLGGRTGSGRATVVASTASGLEVVSSASGAVVRRLTASPAGGVDASPTLADATGAVYFVRSAGSCGALGSSSGLWSVPRRGGVIAEVVQSPADAADLDPVVSTDGHVLAWTRASCRKIAQSLNVRDLRTGAERAISIPDARTVVPVAWMPDDRQLLVEVFSGKPGVALGLLDTGAAVSTSDATPVALPLCAPGTAPALPLLVVAGRFLPDGSLAALTCPPAAGGAATVSAYDLLGAAPPRPLMAALPFPNTVGQLNALALSPDGTAVLGVTTPTPSDIRGKRGNVWRWSGGAPVQLPVVAESVAW